MITRLLSAGLVLAFFGSMAMAVDTVYMVDGKANRVEITKMSSTEVTVEDSGVEEKYPVNTIKYISFDREPAQYKQARTNMEDGSYEDALKMLKELDPTVAGTPGQPKAQELEYLIAKCQAEIALSGGAISKTDAVKAVSEFAQKYQNSYHFYDVCELAGDIYASMGSVAGYKSAVNYYKQLNNAPWPDFQMRASVAMGRIYLAQNDPKSALPFYQKVIASNDKSEMASRQRLIAKMGQAKCLALTGDFAQAQKIVQDELSKAAPEDYNINALAYNTLGLAYVSEGKDKDALVCFLKVDLLYSRDVACHIEALQNLQKLWTKLEQPARAHACVEKLKEYGAVK